MADNKEKAGRKTFNSRFSKWIAGFYAATLIFLVVLIVVVPLFEAMQLAERTIFYSLFSGIILIFIYTIYKAAHMNFVLTEDQMTSSPH